ncbi:MAG TPA: HDIG domain-containing protein, partial [bacterium]|nr:HDIG domain-containing protein [bacterium]
MNPKLFLAGVLEKWAVRLREKKEGAAVKRTGILKREIKVPPVFMAVVFVGTFFWILLLEMGLEKESLGRVALIVLLMAFFAIFAIRHFFHELIKDEEKITFLGLITTLTLLLAAFLKYRNFSDYIIPVPLATILIHVFLGPGLAFLSSIMLSLAFSFIHQFDFIIFLLSFFLSLVALFSTFRVFNRNDIVRAGVFITLSEIFFVLALSIFAGYRFMQTAGVLGVSLLTGFGSSVLAIGILPLVENFFDICSNIKLLEIADFNQPLLKKLITEAPGTYHHSLLVASMAESAASSIGVNPILVRVGAYYHDIGKLYKPD